MEQNLLKSLYCFDNFTKNPPEEVSGVPIISTDEKAEQLLQEDARFILGVGSCLIREQLYKEFIGRGGRAFTFMANNAFVSSQGTFIGEGSNIMAFAFISNRVKIGVGTLINTRAHLHHDVVVDDFCEVGPAAVLLGGVKVGKNTLIGAGAIVLPQLEIGSNCKIGAGAVVTKNVINNKIVKGNPAR